MNKIGDDELSSTYRNKLRLKLRALRQKWVEANRTKRNAHIGEEATKAVPFAVLGGMVGGLIGGPGGAIAGAAIGGAGRGAYSVANCYR